MTLCGLKTVVAESARCRLKFSNLRWHAATKLYYKILIRNLMSPVLTSNNKYLSNGGAEALTVMLSAPCALCCILMRLRAGSC